MIWMHFQINSAATKIPQPLDVLMPVYDPEGKRGTSDPGPYPALYLIHGSRMNSTSWLRQSMCETLTDGKPMAIIMPSICNSFGANMKWGSDYEDFLADELPTLCERMLAVKPGRENRYVAGLSMGGHVALNLGLNHPERFAACASFSGAVNGKVLYTRGYIADPEDLFGTPEEFEQSHYNLFEAAKKLAASDSPKPRILLTCGESDGWCVHNRALSAVMTKAGLDHTLRTWPGAHDWKFWNESYEMLLSWLDGQEV